MANQTKDAWLALPAVSDNPKALGTGVWLRQSEKLYDDDVQYETFVSSMRKERVVTFAWVPYAVASPEQVRSASCSGRCARTCKRPGCLCHRSIGQCK
jgi:hypothetical protein